MIKLICSEKESIIFESNTNLIQKDASPFKEILKKRDYSFYTLEKDDIESFSLENAFQLQVNVKNIGEFHFMIKKEGLDKDSLIKGIASLKEIEVSSEESAKHKLEELFNLFKDINPLFIITYLYRSSLINNEILLSIYKNESPLFYIEDREEDVVDKEIKVEEAKETKSKTIFHHIGKTMTRNKYHLLLIFVSSLLVESTIPLGILNAYSQNALSVFLFVCAVIGVAMNGYTYWDYFQKRSFKDLLFSLSAISNLIGIAGGIGGFAIFYNISNKPENDIGLGKYILIGALVSIGISLLTILISWLLPKLVKKIKKKEN